MADNDTAVVEKPDAGAVDAGPKGAPAAAADEGTAKPAAAKPDGAGKAASAKAAAPAKPDVKPDASAAAAPAKPASSDFLDDDGDDAPDEPADADAKATAAEDWREVFAGGDAAALARLKRFSSQQSFMKSFMNAEKKIRSGEYKKGLGDNPSEEELKAWRAENGIPEKPTDYKLPEVKGVEWTPEDKPVIDMFLNSMHAKNASQGHIDAMLETYAQVKAQADEARVQADIARNEEIQDHLRKEFGAEFRPMTKLMARALNDQELMPGGLGKLFKDARAADGTKLIHTPQFATWLADLAVQNYGAGSMVTGDGTSATLNSREEELVKMMRTNIDEYQNGRNAKGQRYSEELLEIRQRKAGGRQNRA